MIQSQAVGGLAVHGSHGRKLLIAKVGVIFLTIGHNRGNLQVWAEWIPLTDFLELLWGAWRNYRSEQIAAPNKTRKSAGASGLIERKTELVQELEFEVGENRLMRGS